MIQNIITTLLFYIINKTMGKQISIIVQVCQFIEFIINTTKLFD